MVERFIWSPEFSVGNEYLDLQHKVIFGLINKISDFKPEQAPKKFTEKILKQLLEYTSIHFFEEESLMRKYGYPDIQRHIGIHKQLIHQTRMLYLKYQEKGDLILPIVSDFLMKWLKTHILGIDKKYSAYIGRMDKPDNRNLHSSATDIEGLIETSEHDAKILDNNPPDKCEHEPSTNNFERDLLAYFTSKESISKTRFAFEDTSVEEAGQLMREHGATNLLVLNSAEYIVGILTQADLVNRYLAVNIEKHKRHKIGAITSRPVVYVRSENFIEDLGIILSGTSLRHFPVLSGSTCKRGNLVGFVEVSQLCRLLFEKSILIES